MRFGPQASTTLSIGRSGHRRAGCAARCVIGGPYHLVASRLRAELLTAAGAVHPGHVHAECLGLFRRQRHGRDPQAAAEQHRRARAGHEVEPVPERTQAADHVAKTHRHELRGPSSHGFEHDLDAVSIGAIDGERPPQKNAGPTEVDELAGADGRRNLRSVHGDDEHSTGNLADGGDRRVKQVHPAAIPLSCAPPSRAAVRPRHLVARLPPTRPARQPCRGR